MCLVDIYIFLLAGLVDSYPDYITSPGGCTLRNVDPAAPSRSRDVYLSDWVLRRMQLSGDPGFCWKTAEDCNHHAVSCYVLYIFYFIGLTGIFGIYRSSWRFLCRNSLSSLSLARSPCFFFVLSFFLFRAKFSLFFLSFSLLCPFL